MRPQEGGEEGERAAGPRAVPVGLHPLDVRHRVRGRADGDGARLHQVGQEQRGQDGQAGVLCLVESGE